MPLYEFKCMECGHTDEVLTNHSALTNLVCSSCGGICQRVFTAPHVVFNWAKPQRNLAANDVVMAELGLGESHGLRTTSDEQQKELQRMAMECGNTDKIAQEVMAVREQNIAAREQNIASRNNNHG